MALRDILAGEGLLVASDDPALKKALTEWKNSLLWENGQAKRKGKTVLVKRVKFTSATPDFSSLVDEINKKFFKDSGHKVEVSGLIEDVRNPPKQDYSEKNFSYQEYKIVPDGASKGKTAAGFNVSSPFARKLEDLVGPLMGPGSRISVSMGRGEFSSKMGLQIRVIDPNAAIFVSDEEGDEWDQKTEAFQIIMQRAENSLSAFFGLPVHTEGTEESVIVFTVELRVQS